MALKQFDLKNYANELQELGLLAEENLLNSEDTIVKGLEFNSKDVEPGTLFICKGANFKTDYLKEAIDRGAFAYVAESKQAVDEEIPYILVSDIRKAMAPMAEKFYNAPHEKLKIIGIGGTKGKTTTAYYVKAILDTYLEAEAKQPAGLISTIATFDGLTEKPSKNTTAEALILQRHLANAVEAGLEYVVMEVSSQALKYHRTDGIEFDVGIFLNIDEDHISPVEHPDFADYLASKAKMFKQTKQLIVNNETQEAAYIFEKALDAEHYYTFSLAEEKADYYADNIETVHLESNFTVQAADFTERYTLSMPGEFNIENALAAIAATNLLGISQEYAKEALSKVVVPGRMGVYSTPDKEIIAISDYAHNRLSFERLATSMQKAYPTYQLVSVFGAPGGKALGRREELGSVGGAYSDYVYITMDDPEYEDVQDISREIATYVEKEDTPYEIIEDRTEAIQKAIREAKEKTIVLAIGKGHETTMKIKGELVPMKSDNQVIEEAIQNYKKATKRKE
jgi:UDP-N-acetylmuramoyl-L-alanyl-D-glutamate--2,6-diaminopimelate ligase